MPGITRASCGWIPIVRQRNQPAHTRLYTSAPRLIDIPVKRSDIKSAKAYFYVSRGRDGAHPAVLACSVVVRPRKEEKYHDGILHNP